MPTESLKCGQSQSRSAVSIKCTPYFEDTIKKEIVEVSSVLTEKVLEREVKDSDHQHFIDSFIESIGEDDGAN